MGNRFWGWKSPDDSWKWVYFSHNTRKSFFFLEILYSVSNKSNNDSYNHFDVPGNFREGTESPKRDNRNTLIQRLQQGHSRTVVSTEIKRSSICSTTHSKQYQCSSVR